MRLTGMNERGYALITVLLLMMLLMVIIPTVYLSVLQSTKQITKSQYDIQYERLTEIGVAFFSTEDENQAIALSEQHCVIFAVDHSWANLSDDGGACTCHNAIDLEGLGVIPVYKNKCGLPLALIHEGGK